jgi:hypothetical protein
MLAELGLAADPPHFVEKRMNPAEGREHLAVGGAERVGVDGSRRHQRRRHVPVSQHHPERRIPCAADDLDELGKRFRIEIAQEPLARFPEHGLAPQLEQLQVQRRALEWRRHVALYNRLMNRTPVAS